MSNYNIEKQHVKGKYHAFERIGLLLDKSTFREIGSGIVNYSYDKSDSEAIPYDGVITGSGKIRGKTVYVFAQDFSVKGGTLGLRHGRKIAHIIKLAITAKCPIIGIYDSGGARIDEGINALAGCGEMMHYNTLASGYIPQISIIVGPCAGAAAYSPAITDFVFMVDRIGNMFITGADVVKSVTGESCTTQELGGTKVHMETSGVAHFGYNSEKECFSSVRKLVNTLPASYLERKEYPFLNYIDKDTSAINSILPDEAKKVYDMKDVIRAFVDEESFIEVHSGFAKSMVVGFAKLSGITIGIVSSQPLVNCGSIDCNSSDKASRFVRFCDSFNIPIITLVDTPGYLPGMVQEHSGIIRHGAKLLYAYSEATVQKLTVVLRKAYGGAYIAMGSKHLGADFVYAWPNAEIAVMGAESAASVLYKKKSSEMKEEDQKQFLKQKTEEYAQLYMNADIAIQEGYVDEIIEPGDMRKRLFTDIIALADKEDCFKINKKHGNIPL
jgi:acetyl-CoA carboxylase carboxyltransferase component